MKKNKTLLITSIILFALSFVVYYEFFDNIIIKFCMFFFAGTSGIFLARLRKKSNK